MENNKCKYDGCQVDAHASCYGFCVDHYRQSLKDKWDPSNGVDGIINFAFDCFPDLFERKYGLAGYHRKMLELILEGLNSGGYTNQNLFLIKAYRGSSKSTWMNVAIPAYCIAYNLKRFIVILNDSQAKAINVSMYRLREALSSDLFEFVFGNMSFKAPDSKTEKVWNRALFVCNNKVNTMVAGIGLSQSMRSKVSKTIRPDLLICDDMESEENTSTEDIRIKNSKRFWERNIPAMDIHGMIVVIQTPVHPDSLYYELVNSGRFKLVDGWVYKQDEEGNFLRDESGSFIPQWPSRHPIEWIRDQEDLYRSNPKLGISSFNQEYLGLLVTDETRQIKEEWLRYCQIVSTHYSGANWVSFASIDGLHRRAEDDEERYLVTRILAVDPATSEGAKACNTAGVVVDYHYDGRVVVVDYFFGKYATTDALKEWSGEMDNFEVCMDTSKIMTRGIVGETFRMANKWLVDKIVVEDVGAFAHVVNIMETTYRNWYSFRFNHFIRWDRYNPAEGKYTKAKDDRILSAIMPATSSRRLFLNGKMVELKDEIVNLGAWKSKDIVDALHINILASETPQKKTLLDNKVKKKRKQKAPQTLEEVFYA